MLIDFQTPVAVCLNQLRNSDLRCEILYLPFPKLPISGIDPVLWPPDGWRAKLGCPGCGYVTVYSSGDVHWAPVQHEEGGQYRADTVCVLVESECAQLDCKTPVIFHTTIADRSQKSYDDLKNKLKSGFFHGVCSRRHDFLISSVAGYRRIAEAWKEIQSGSGLPEKHR